MDLIFLSASLFLASKNNLKLPAIPKEAYRFQPNRLLTFVKKLADRKANLIFHLNAEIAQRLQFIFWTFFFQNIF